MIFKKLQLFLKTQKRLLLWHKTIKISRKNKIWRYLSGLVQTSVFRFLKNTVLLATLTQKLKNIRDFSKFYFFQMFLEKSRVFQICFASKKVDFEKNQTFSEISKLLATVTQNHQYFVNFLLFDASFQSRQHVFWFLKNVVLLATLTQKLKNIRDFSKIYFFSDFFDGFDGKPGK